MSTSVNPTPRRPAVLPLALGAAIALFGCADRSSASPDGGTTTLPDGAVAQAPDGAARGVTDGSMTSPRDGSAPRDGGSAEAGSLPLPADLAAQHCDPKRPGFAYAAGTGSRSTPLAAPTGSAPVPCYHLSNYGAAESSLVVTANGSVLYAPVFTADGAGVLISRDQGERWDVSVPKLDNGGAHGRVQPYMMRDPVTDRVIFASNATVGKQSPELLGFNLTLSDDAGKTWTASHLPIDANDWVKIYAGKPRSVKTNGYPNVLYASAPNPISTPVPYASLIGVKPDHQSFYRSLDGGKTWEAAGRVSLLYTDTPGCDQSEWLIFGAGTTAPDGTAYQMMRRCTTLSLAISSDDGTTWTLTDVPGSKLPKFDTGSLTGIISNPNVLVTEGIAVDSAGNLYMVYVDDLGSLRLQTSKDAARTFSAPITVQAPDVNAVVYGAVAVKEPGTIALAYYGSRDHGVSYDGYLAETTNALDAAPTFASVIVNPPEDPLYKWGYEVGYLGILELADLNEIIQVRYAPNGDIWGSFSKDMCDGTSHYGTCAWDLASHENSGIQGVVGRMVHGRAPAFAEAPATAAPPAPGTCQYDNLPGVSECRSLIDSASDNGVCDELAGCVCNKCRCEVFNCEKDPKCVNLLVCAAKNNCRGQECLVLCPGEVKLAGDLLAMHALDVAACANQASCPMIQFCPLDFLFPPGS